MHSIYLKIIASLLSRTFGDVYAGVLRELGGSAILRKLTSPGDENHRRLEIDTYVYIGAIFLLLYCCCNHLSQRRSAQR